VLRPAARWIQLSTATAALLPSFTALPLTAWMLVRCFRVVGDCKRSSVREDEDCELRAGGALEDEGASGVVCAM